MPRRTKEEAQATRDHLLDTAELVFLQRGVSRTSLNELAAAAGVSRGAIYWHFQDKTDLFNAMMERVTLPLEEAIGRTADPANADPLAEVRRTLLDALRLTATDPRVCRVFEIATHKVEYVDELSGVRDRHLRVRDQCLAQVQQGLGRAMRLGQIGRQVPARNAAIGLHALIDGLIQNWLLDQTAFDLVKVGRQVVEAYLVGLAPVPSEPASAA
jgi:TetR/AcrR family acrAB operon transcriptional repressor